MYLYLSTFHVVKCLAAMDLYSYPLSLRTSLTCQVLPAH